MFEVFFGIWQFLLVFGVGLGLTRWASISPSYGFRLAASFGFGMSAFSMGFLLLGTFGGLRPSLLFPVSMILTLPALWSIYSESAPLAKAVTRSLKSSPFAFALMMVLLFIYFLGACVPEREEDAIWYHLGVPIYYLYHGGFIQEVPFNLPSHYPMYGQLHYVLSLALGNDSTAKVFAFCQFFPILLLIGSTCRRLGHSDGAVSGCVLYLCSVHFQLPVMANVQGEVYFFTFLSMVFLWEALDKNSMRDLLLGAFFCGMAMGTKMNALLFCYLAQVLLILGWMVGMRPGWRRSISFLLLHSGIAWLVLSPWLLKSFWVTGNPLFPMLSEVFGCYPRFLVAMETTADLHGIVFLKAATLAEAWDHARHNFSTLISETDLLFSLGIVSLVLLPFLRFRAHLWVWSTSAIAYLLLTQIWGGATGRLFGVVETVLTVLIVSVLSELKALLRWNKSRFSQAIFPVTLLLFASSFFFIRIPYLQNPGIRWTGEVALGEEARREWLIERGVRSADSLEMEDWMKANVPPEDEIYVAPLGYLSSLQRKFVASDKYFGEQFFVWVEEGIANQQLSGLGVDWLLLDSLHIDLKAKPRLEDYLSKNWVPTMKIGTQTLYRKR